MLLNEKVFSVEDVKTLMLIGRRNEEANGMLSVRSAAAYAEQVPDLDYVTGQISY